MLVLYGSHGDEEEETILEGTYSPAMDGLLPVSLSALLAQCEHIESLLRMRLLK